MNGKCFLLLKIIKFTKMEQGYQEYEDNLDKLRDSISEQEKHLLPQRSVL